LSTAGARTLTATYAGDSNFAGNVSNGAVSFTVNKAMTEISKPTASGSLHAGQPVTFFATVSVNAPGSGTPTGTISFNDGTVLIGTGSVNASGTASVTTSALSTGNHNVTAVYSGDANFLPSNTSERLGLTIDIDTKPSTVLVSASANSTVYGQGVTYTATLTTGATGTVNFLDNGVVVNSAPIVVSANQAQYSPAAPFGAGNHSITAVYTGDSNFAGSTSTALAVVVSKANTAITVSAVQDGLSITFTATVAVTAPGAGTPTGAAQLFNSSTLVGATTLSAFKASLTTLSLFGDFTAVYQGDSNFNGSTSGVVHVAKPLASLTLRSSVNPSSLGQTVTLTAPLTVVAGNGIPTGSVQFFDGSNSLGTANLVNSRASLDTSGLSAGAHTLTATYSGDAVFGPTSASTDMTVNRLTTSLGLTLSSAEVIFGQPVIATVQLGPAPPAGVAAPTGNITFQEGGKTLGAASPSSSSATLTLDGLDVGLHQIDAQYAGDKNWTSAGASAVVNIKRAAVSITTSSLPDGGLGSPYTATLGATGGTPPYQWTISGLPQGLSGDASGAISGTPTAEGKFSATVEVRDHNGATASASLALNVMVQPLAITTSSLPNARQGSDYAAGLAASGGVPPYTWNLSASDADDIGVSSDGAVSGRPLSAGGFQLIVQVTDSRGTKASRPVTLVVTGIPLAIVTSALSGGIIGSPYSQTLTAAGGTPPYTWGGTLPAGLAIHPSTGAITGSTVAAGSTSIGITVQDHAGASAARAYTVQFGLPPAPDLTIEGLGDTAAPQSQPTIQVTVANPYPAPITGTLTLSFRADVGGDDQMVQFSSGGRTVSFTIPSNASTAAFSIPSLALQTGTVAGLITLTAHLEAAGTDITPAPAPARPIRINAAAPAISSVEASHTSTGFTVVTNGFSTSREITQAVFHFNGAVGANLQTTDIAVAAGPIFDSWFQSAAVSAFGSQFLFVQSFTVQGDMQAIASVTVKFVNAQGDSQQFTAAIQ